MGNGFTSRRSKTGNLVKIRYSEMRVCRFYKALPSKMASADSFPTWERREIGPDPPVFRDEETKS